MKLLHWGPRTLPRYRNLKIYNIMLKFSFQQNMQVEVGKSGEGLGPLMVGLAL